MAQNLYVDGTEMTQGEFSWANVVATSFDSFQNMAEPYNSSERILQSFFNFINEFHSFNNFSKGRILSIQMRGGL